MTAAENEPIGDSCSADETISVVHRLRRRWKPIKEGSASTSEHEDIRIRLHRFFIWLQRIEDLREHDADSDDARLMYGWVAMNSLYGRWDSVRREPVPDGKTMDGFIQAILESDRDAVLVGLLEEHKKLVEAIVADEYLNRYYWKDPGETAARRAHNGVQKLRSWYRERIDRLVMDAVLFRIYTARCQLIHGAATFDGGLNRTPVRRCAIFMDLALPAMATVIIDHAWADDWGDLCYPPQR